MLLLNIIVGVRTVPAYSKYCTLNSYVQWILISINWIQIIVVYCKLLIKYVLKLHEFILSRGYMNYLSQGQCILKIIAQQHSIICSLRLVCNESNVLLIKNNVWLTKSQPFQCLCPFSFLFKHHLCGLFRFHPKPFSLTT
jgi:hypothetical protein